MHQQDAGGWIDPTALCFSETNEQRGGTPLLIPAAQSLKWMDQHLLTAEKQNFFPESVKDIEVEFVVSNPSKQSLTQVPTQHHTSHCLSHHG